MQAQNGLGINQNVSAVDGSQATVFCSSIRGCTISDR